MIMNTWKKLIPDMVAVVLFAVISFVYFYPAVTEGRILSQHDSVAGIGAGQESKEYMERTGERTRWTNSIFGGMPTYQMSPSYESTDMLKAIENLYHLYLPTYVWYVFVMLLGFYILLRAFDFKAWMSALGAIVWAFSSYFFIIIAAGHIWKFITLAYIPPTIAGMVLCYRGKYGIGCLLTALFVALQIAPRPTAAVRSWATRSVKHSCRRSPTWWSSATGTWKTAQCPSVPGRATTWVP